MSVLFTCDYCALKCQITVERDSDSHFYQPAMNGCAVSSYVNKSGQRVSARKVTFDAAEEVAHDVVASCVDYHKAKVR